MSIALFTLIFFAVISIYLYWNSFAPNYEGKVQLEALSEQVNVQFDDFGVPHIKAQNAQDAYRSFGYIKWI